MPHSRDVQRPSWKGLFILALMLACLPLAAGRASPEQRDVARRARLQLELVILGSFPVEAITGIQAALRAQLPVDVLATDSRALPAEAYYAPRKRHRAERLLTALEQGKARGVARLGLTEVDISTTKGKHKDWGVFGLASIGGDAAVLSTYRLRRDHPAAALYRFRIVTTAVHEVGHMLGLDHCAEPRCVMNDAEGSIRVVDASSGELGPLCRRQLDRGGS